MGYRKPTLVETYSELYLAADTLTESRFFDVVPALKAAGFTEVELGPGGIQLPGEGSIFPRETQRVRCWKPSRTELVQIGQDQVILNLRGEYPGWDAFLRLFDEGYNAVNDSLGEISVRSLNLHTIDRFEAPREGFEISRYLDPRGGILPSWFEGCSESLDLDMGRGLLDPDGYNKQVHVKVQAATDPVRVQIRCNFHNEVETSSDLLDVLEHLHVDSTETFEALITDYLRNAVMEGQDS